MRRPGMSTLLDQRGPKGLSHILRDEAPVDQSAAENRVEQVAENLDFIASGSRPVNPAELLSSDRFSVNELGRHLKNSSVRQFNQQPGRDALDETKTENENDR